MRSGRGRRVEKHVALLDPICFDRQTHGIQDSKKMPTCRSVLFSF